MLSTLFLCAAMSATPSAGPSANDVAETLTIRLPLETHVDGTQIELGEVAELSGAPTASGRALVERLRAVPIGYAPSPGYSRVLRQDQVRAALARRAPDVQVRFEGQRATRVWPELETVLEVDLLAAAQDALVRHAGGGALNLVPLDAPGDVEVPASEGGARLRARVQSEVGDSTTVAIELLVEDGIFRTVRTRWRAERFVEVPVLARDVAAGEELTAGDFRLERRAIAGSRRDGLAPEALVGTTAARSLSAGSTVGSNDVRREFVVRAGANLVLAVKKGAIEARVSAVALEGAAIGSRFRVRTNQGEQELTARLVNADLAVIDLGS